MRYRPMPSRYPKRRKPMTSCTIRLLDRLSQTSETKRPKKQRSTERPHEHE